MKEITRTVFYVQRDGKDIYACDSKRDAMRFATLQDFDEYHIIEVDIIGHSSYPEMLNAKYDSGDSVDEDAPAEPQNKIRYRYLVQYQTPEMNAGWLSVDYSTPLSINAYNHAKNLVKAGIAIATRIKRVGYLV